MPMIIGEIRRFLLDSSSVRVSRSLRDTAYKALQARQQLEAGNSFEADLEDIAKAVDLPLKEVVYAIDAISDPVSLFAPVCRDDGDAAMLTDQISDGKNTDFKARFFWLD